MCFSPQGLKLALNILINNNLFYNAHLQHTEMMDSVWTWKWYSPNCSISIS